MQVWLYLPMMLVYAQNHKFYFWASEAHQLLTWNYDNHTIEFYETLLLQMPTVTSSGIILAQNSSVKFRIFSPCMSPTQKAQDLVHMHRPLVSVHLQLSIRRTAVGDSKIALKSQKVNLLTALRMY